MQKLQILIAGRWLLSAIRAKSFDKVKEQAEALGTLLGVGPGLVAVERLVAAVIAQDWEQVLRQAAALLTVAADLIFGAPATVFAAGFEAVGETAPPKGVLASSEEVSIARELIALAAECHTIAA